MRKFKQEYIGLETEIVESKNPEFKTIKGKIIDETKNTFKIKTKDKIITIIKSISIFKINDQIINGEKITKKPEDRIKGKY